MNWQPLFTAVLLAAAACTVVPEGRFPPFEEREVIASYYGGSPVQVPSSRQDLTIWDLTTDPVRVRESFRDGRRWLHPAGQGLEVRCRYRVYPVNGDWPEPTSLFPEASEVKTVWQRRGGRD